MNEQISILKQEVHDVLTQNILPFWLDKMTDREHGGFYGRIDGHMQLHPEAEKGAILNARILWSFSAAYRVLCKPEYLEAATRAKDYIIDHFIDKEYGGVYWSLDYKGQPLDTKKQFYAIGFAIYGLSEYARATGDREALDYALQLFDCIEEHAFDQEYNGYIEATTRDWQPIADMRLSDLDANYPKSQNTHLHIIEPYTNLYRCLKEFQAASSCSYVPAIGAILPVDIAVSQQTVGRVGASVRNLIRIFTDRILNPETHHLDLFFEKDWTRGAGHLESYGHDIECSWLMHEAALVLGDQQMLEKVEPIVRMVAKASEKGLRPDGSMIHEANLDTGHRDDDLHWWVQAENVVGWANLYQHFGDEDALQKALNGWNYIKQNLIDYADGEWYWSRRPDGTLNLDDDHAGFWKCPYHNSRMCLELMERF
ncbi:MAG: AGE family epimerase/isomerase [Prevotella sp.]|nr:AGE family epimerase/isomerase [Prevotella sp.]